MRPRLAVALLVFPLFAALPLTSSPRTPFSKTACLSDGLLTLTLGGKALAYIVGCDTDRDPIHARQRGCLEG